jgi:hypothetical protein
MESLIEAAGNDGQNLSTISNYLLFKINIL